MDLWPFVGAVVLPAVGIVALVVLAVYAVVWVAIEVRGAILRRRRRRRRREAGQGCDRPAVEHGCEDEAGGER